MRTFSIHTSRSQACTPSTAVKIHPGNSQPPTKPQVNPRNIPRLLPFKLSTNATYTDHNPQPKEHRRPTASYFVLHLFFLIIIPLSKEQQQVYYVLKPINTITVRTYPVCVKRVFHFKNTFCFWRERKKKKTACLWRLPNLIPSPQLISDVQLLPHKIMTSRQ